MVKSCPGVLSRLRPCPSCVCLGCICLGYVLYRLCLSGLCRSTRLLAPEDPVLNNFSKEDRGKIMAGTFTMELSRCLSSSPSGVLSAANKQIKTFGQKRAGTDGPVGPVTLLVFVVALVQYYSPDVIHFTEGNIIEVGYKCRHTEVKMS